jgi:shikimate dehydrogenase
LPVRPEAFGLVLAALVELGFRGVNVTVPHKQVALAACDEIDLDAERIGAVNTIVITGGRTRGSNSDGYGFLENLRQGAPGWQAASGPAVVLGAGGAARAVVAALLDAGAPEIRLVNRTRARAEALAEALGGSLDGSLGGPLAIADWSERHARLRDAALLVNTTTLGMADGQPLDLDLDRLPGAALVNDIVYTPLETPLLAAARARGNPVVDGLGMLLHQARPGFAAWFGVEPEVTEELRRFVLAD